MKVLITGGAGFIGSNLAERLLAQGRQVASVDNYATARKDFLAPRAGLKVYEGSVADRDLLAEIFAEFGPDRVVHAAASYKDPDNWEEDAATNVTGTINALKLSREHQVRRFVYLQTALCYGAPRERPITLAHPLNPTSSYAVTKTAGEHFTVQSGLPYVSLRLANVYGPRHFSGPIPTFYKRLKAGQKCFVVDTRRDFIDLEDLLILLDSILAGEGPDGCYNVSSGRDCTIKEIFDLMVDRLGVKLTEPVEVLPPGEDDVSTLLLDPSATREAFGWEARIPLSEGIERLIQWYEVHGVEEAYTHLQIGKK